LIQLKYASKEPITWRLEKQDLERQVKDLKKRLDDVSTGEVKKAGFKLRRQESSENFSKDSSPASKSDADDLKRKLDDVSHMST
jgi:hypothetical protein